MTSVSLNGWQRIGIIASGAWIIFALANELPNLDYRAQQAGDVSFKACVDNPGTPYNVPDRPLTDSEVFGDELKLDTCRKVRSDVYRIERTSRLQVAALLALAPVIVGWLATYFAIWLVRWVRRGFQQPANS